MQKKFPRTKVENLSLSRMLIGSNWMLGWSHTGAAADDRIKRTYKNPADFFPIFEAYAAYGIDCVMGIVGELPLFGDAIRYAGDKLGKPLTIIDTPILNVDDNAAARRESEEIIKRSARAGAKICMPHHSCAEKLVRKDRAVIERIDDYTKMIRDAGMIPGLSAHMPELIVYSDENGYDVQTYIQIYNCLGFLMQVEIETVSAIIHSAKKPVMTIKPMGAGRCTPYVGLNFSWATLRDQDMVTVGCFTPEEVHEDVEISFAALERRMPSLEKRASPNQEQAAFGGDEA